MLTSRFGEASHTVLLLSRGSQRTTPAEGSSLRRPRNPHSAPRLKNLDRRTLNFNRKIWWKVWYIQMFESYRPFMMLGLVLIVLGLVLLSLPFFLRFIPTLERLEKLPKILVYVYRHVIHINYNRLTLLRLHQRYYVYFTFFMPGDLFDQRRLLRSWRHIS